MSRSWEWPNRSVNSFRDSVLRVIRRCLEEFVKGPSFLTWVTSRVEFVVDAPALDAERLAGLAC